MVSDYDKVIDELLKDKLHDWIQTASEEDKLLLDKVYDFEDFFGDMLFTEGTETNRFVQCQLKNSEGAWMDGEIDLPDAIKYFAFNFFTYHVKALDNGFAGQFNCKDYSLTVAPEYLTDDSVILHEMIHMYEFVLNLFPLFYHDAVLWCLYRKLMCQIPDLNNRIEAHGHILNSRSIANRGGTHDVLFLLKSLDLDLQKGYKLGTVFGYGMAQQVGE